MSLFGTSYPKMQYYDINTSTWVDVLLQYSYVEPDWTEPQVVEQYYLDGTRDFLAITNEDHASFKVFVYLFKLGNLTAMRQKFKEIYALNHKTVRFFPNSDGASLRDSAGNPALFNITKIDMIYLTKPQELDTLVIYLKSTTPIDLDNQL